LLKTFWTGVGGWADKQLPDGTVQWRSPSGRVYTTKPGGSLFFPVLATPTGEAAIRKPTTEPGQGRGLMMPRRTRTRHQERQVRITADRRINQARPHRRRTAARTSQNHRQRRIATVLMQSS
jgi:hypothetical protein